MAFDQSQQQDRADSIINAAIAGLLAADVDGELARSLVTDLYLTGWEDALKAYDVLDALRPDGSRVSEDRPMS